VGGGGQAARSDRKLREQSMDGNNSRTPNRHPAGVSRSPARHGAPKAAMGADWGVIAGMGGVARCDVDEAGRLGSSRAPSRRRYGQKARQY
jgi:hypothetical protein